MKMTQGQWNDMEMYINMMTLRMETFSTLPAICEESIGHLTKASDTALWCFLWSAPQQMAEWTFEMPVISDAIALIMLIYEIYSIWKGTWNNNLGLVGKLLTYVCMDE